MVDVVATGDIAAAAPNWRTSANCPPNVTGRLRRGQKGPFGSTERAGSIGRSLWSHWTSITFFFDDMQIFCTHVRQTIWCVRTRAQRRWWGKRALRILKTSILCLSLLIDMIEREKKPCRFLFMNEIHVAWALPIIVCTCTVSMITMVIIWWPRDHRWDRLPEIFIGNGHVRYDRAMWGF